MRSLAFALIALLATEPVTFAAVQERAVSWADFRQEVGQQRLTGRRINVTVSSARRRVGSVLRRVEAEALVVEENPNTTKWPTADRESRIPRTEVVAVEFLGRKGHGGLIGGLAGLAAGAALAVAGAAGSESGGSADSAVVLVIPLAGAAGYFIGRRGDKPLPHFRILP